MIDNVSQFYNVRIPGVFPQNVSNELFSHTKIKVLIRTGYRCSKNRSCSYGQKISGLLIFICACKLKGLGLNFCLVVFKDAAVRTKREKGT